MKRTKKVARARGHLRAASGVLNVRAADLAEFDCLFMGNLSPSLREAGFGEDKARELMRKNLAAYPSTPETRERAAKAAAECKTIHDLANLLVRTLLRVRNGEAGEDELTAIMVATTAEVNRRETRH